MSYFISREKIELKPAQNQLIKSGWGEETLNNSVVEKITYLSDDLKVNGYLAYPQNIPESKKLPCIIWNRGGYLDKGAIDPFNARGMYGLMASWGYLVFASHYRGNKGSGGKEELGSGDVNDILNLIPLADEFEFADTANWGIEGWSRGGMMTYLTLLKDKRFKCAVLAGAISDLSEIVKRDVETNKIYHQVLGSENFEKKLKERSAINFADKLPKETAYLLLHGTDDNTVSPSQSIKMAEKFLERNMKFRFLLLEEGDHYLSRHRREVDMLRKKWFDKYLR